jgi:hypothetical protein
MSGTFYLAALGCILLFLCVFAKTFLSKRGSQYFYMDPQDNLTGPDDPRTERLRGRRFEPIMERYMDFAKTIIGLAAGSITLLIGILGFLLKDVSATVAGRIDMGPPIICFCFCILYLVLFLGSLTACFESYLVNPTSYTPFWYSLNISLAYSGVLCLTLGYFWLSTSVAKLSAH